MVTPLAVALLAALLGAVVGDYALTVVHTNDMHSRFAPTNVHGGECLHGDSCYGGFARVKAAVRLTKTLTYPKDPIVFLNAGDTFQGDSVYNAYKWPMVARMLDMLGIDVMSLGVHEFDDGVGSLVDFLANVTTPVVACNLVLPAKLPGSELAALVQDYVILDRTSAEGTPFKIAVIGYITPETQFLSSAEDVGFADEVRSIRKQVKRVREKGANVTIALGHSGFAKDKEIARDVEGVDLVVGGLTNTFLYRGKKGPSIEVPEASYPYQVKQKSGKWVPVVQAHAYTKYLGVVRLIFDSNFNLTYGDGRPLLLDEHVGQDVDIVKELQANWQLSGVVDRVVGYSKVVLEGKCRKKECNYGNLVTDAFVDFCVRGYTYSGWTDAPIAVVNGGNIRITIDKLRKKQHGVITYGDLMAGMPFNNPMNKITLTGRELRALIEHSAAVYERGGFLQYSGVKVEYRLNAPAGHQLVSVKVRCGKCRVPRFSPLVEGHNYTVIISDHLLKGGDGYVIPNNSGNVRPLGVSDLEIVEQYLATRSPVYPGLEGRITFQRKEKPVTRTYISNPSGSQCCPPGVVFAFFFVHFFHQNLLGSISVFF